MPYLVRKINKRESLMQIGAANNIVKMFADAATTEFRSKDGTLSAWWINSIDDLNEAVLAIVITSSKVERMDFIIINTQYLEEQKLQYVKTSSGHDMAIQALEERHYDIINITIPRLIDCSYVYKKIFQEDSDRDLFIKRYAKGDLVDLLKNAEARLDSKKLSSDFKKSVSSLFPQDCFS